MAQTRLTAKKSEGKDVKAIIEAIIQNGLFDGSQSVEAYENETSYFIDDEICDHTEVITALAKAQIVSNLTVEYDDDGTEQIFVLREDMDGLTPNHPQDDMWCSYYEYVNENVTFNKSTFIAEMSNLTVTAVDVFDVVEKIINELN